MYVYIILCVMCLLCRHDGEPLHALLCLKWLIKIFTRLYWSYLCLTLTLLCGRDDWYIGCLVRFVMRNWSFMSFISQLFGFLFCQIKIGSYFLLVRVRRVFLVFSLLLLGYGLAFWGVYISCVIIDHCCFNFMFIAQMTHPDTVKHSLHRLFWVIK